MKQQTNNYTTSLILVGILFFIFGFVTWLNGTLIPYLKLTCNLDTDTKAFLVTFAFYMAYFFLAIPSSKILEKTGMKRGMSIGLIVMAVGALVFIPAAGQRSFGMFLAGLFIQGMGLSLMQTAVNPYVSILGPIDSAAQRISIMGIFNKVAGMIAPIVFGAVLLGNSEGISAELQSTLDMARKEQLLSELANRIVLPYQVLAVILLLLAIGIRKSPLPDISGEKEDENNQNTASRGSIWDYPYAILGALAIFFYVGAEVMAGDVIGTYGKNLGFSLDESKYFTSFTLGAMLIGYLVSLVLIPRYIKQETWLLYCTVLGIVLTIMAYFTTGSTAVTCIAALGFANAVMWPAIFPLGIAGLGKHTAMGSALLIMGIAGGALIPQVYGILSEKIGFQAAFLATMIPCYLYIIYFALKGHKVGK